MSQDLNSGVTITTLDLKEIIKYLAIHKESLFVWGGPGTGKSESIKQAAEDLGGISIDVRLGQLEPTDLIGLPYLSRIDGKEVVKWAPSSLFPTQKQCDPYPYVILFLDEMNHAPPMTQSACFQLILDRKLGQYKLPDNVVVVAAGNRQSDKGATYQLAGPLKNRFVHVELVPDFEAWLAWAAPNHIHPDVIGYLAWRNDHLYMYDSTTKDNAFPTPRSWVKASKLITPDEDFPMPNEDIIEAILAGTIGGGVAGDFLEQRKLAAQLPDPEDILNGKALPLKDTLKENREDKSKTNQTSLQHILASSVCHKLHSRFLEGKKLEGKEDKKVAMRSYYDGLSNSFHYIKENFTEEMLVAMVGMIYATYGMYIVPKMLTGNVFAGILNKVDHLIEFDEVDEDE